MSAPKTNHVCPDYTFCRVCCPEGLEEYCENTTKELHVKDDDPSASHGYIVRYEYNEARDWRDILRKEKNWKYWHDQQLRIPHTHTVPRASLASQWAFGSTSTNVVAVGDYIVIGTGYSNLGPGNKRVGRILDLRRVIKTTPKKIYMHATQEPFELLALTHSLDHQVPRFENKKFGYHAKSFFKKAAIEEMDFIKT